MSLTKDDLTKIKKVIDASNHYFDIQWQKRFGGQDLKIDRLHGEVKNLAQVLDERFR